MASKKQKKQNIFSMYMRIVLAFAVLVIALVISLLLVSQQIALIDENRVEVDESVVESRDFLAQFNRLTAVQREVLLDARVHDTDAERVEYSRLLDTQAATTQNIDISNCIADPLVARVEIDQPLAFVNNYSTERVVQFGSRFAIAIPPQTVAVVEDLYSHGQGLYNFTCDISDHSAGILIVQDSPEA